MVHLTLVDVLSWTPIDRYCVQVHELLRTPVDAWSAGGPACGLRLFLRNHGSCSLSDRLAAHDLQQRRYAMSSQLPGPARMIMPIAELSGIMQCQADVDVCLGRLQTHQTVVSSPSIHKHTPEHPVWIRWWPCQPWSLSPLSNDQIRQILRNSLAGRSWCPWGAPCTHHRQHYKLCLWSSIILRTHCVRLLPAAVMHQHRPYKTQWWKAS